MLFRPLSLNEGYWSCTMNTLHCPFFFVSGVLRVRIWNVFVYLRALWSGILFCILWHFSVHVTIWCIFCDCSFYCFVLNFFAICALFLLARVSQNALKLQDSLAGLNPGSFWYQIIFMIFSRILGIRKLVRNQIQICIGFRRKMYGKIAKNTKLRFSAVQFLV